MNQTPTVVLVQGPLGIKAFTGQSGPPAWKSYADLITLAVESTGRSAKPTRASA